MIILSKDHWSEYSNEISGGAEVVPTPPSYPVICWPLVIGDNDYIHMSYITVEDLEMPDDSSEYDHLHDEAVTLLEIAKAMHHVEGWGWE
jgi:hypothetical protein